MRQALVWGLLLVALGCWWRTLAPTSLDGPIGHVVVSGTSMQPLLHTGDLVLTHREPTYHLGELVVVRVDGGYVIHRLHDGNARIGWHTKGDNRRTVDSWVVHPSDVVGKQWITWRGFTTDFAFLWSPWTRPTSLALFVLGLLLPTRRRRNGRTSEALAKRTRTPRRRAMPLLELVGFVGVFGAALLSAFELLGALRDHNNWGVPVLALVVAAAMTAVLGARLFRGIGCAEPRRTFARLGDRVIDVSDAPAGEGDTRVCQTAAQLARISDRSKLPIIHTEVADQHLFSVLTDSTTYELHCV